MRWDWGNDARGWLGESLKWNLTFIFADMVSYHIKYIEKIKHFCGMALCHFINYLIVHCSGWKWLAGLWRVCEDADWSLILSCSQNIWFYLVLKAYAFILFSKHMILSCSQSICILLCFNSYIPLLIFWKDFWQNEQNVFKALPRFLNASHAAFAKASHLRRQTNNKCDAAVASMHCVWPLQEETLLRGSLWYKRFKLFTNIGILVFRLTYTKAH